MLSRRKTVRGALIAVATISALGVALGCGKKARKRTGDAAAVEIVTMPALPDAGGRGGPPTNEVEPNDADDVATVLAIGGTVHGKIDPDGDLDHYRIDVTQAGALSVMVDCHDALDVDLQIEDDSGNVLARSERGGARIREGVPNLGVAPGRYTVVVQARKPPPPKPSRKRPARRAPEPPKPLGGPYEITADLVVPGAGLEHEPDDDRGQANDLIVGDSASGYIGWTGDADVWKVSVEALSAKNALDIELSAIEGSALTLEISDGIGKSIIARKGARGAPLVVRGFAPAVPQGAPPFHYLTVRADRSNPETAYQLRASGKVIEPDAEIEPDDTPSTAMAVTLERKSVHARWSTGDVDCFAVPPSDAARTIEVSIDTPGALDLALDAYLEGQVVGKVDHPGKGAAEKLAAPVPAGGKVVICVRGAELPADETYELVINEGAAPP